MKPALYARLSTIGKTLEQQFIGKDEVIRLLLVALVAGEHVVLIGPPGTAKSAIVRSLARLVRARYFEYLLTRFTEPNEIFGPVDIKAFREGQYRRRVEGMIPDSEIVFLDEIFKSSSAILNALLTMLNERVFAVGAEVIKCPLVSVIGASNEVPQDETLTAIFDRFLLRIRSDNLDAYHFSELLQRGISLESQHAQVTDPQIEITEISQLHRSLVANPQFDSDFLSAYKGLIFQTRAEGITISDRRVVKMLKLFLASAFLDGRNAPDKSDFFVLKHIWNSEDQAPILEAIIQPELDSFYREFPDRKRVGSVGVGVEALSEEIERIRQVITGGSTLGDVQLFSQLKALGEIKTALATMQDERARKLEKRVQDLLDASFKTGRFANL
jgi:MoxR-like ATPase